MLRQEDRRAGNLDSGELGEEVLVFADGSGARSHLDALRKRCPGRRKATDRQHAVGPEKPVLSASEEMPSDVACDVRGLSHSGPSNS